MYEKQIQRAINYLNEVYGPEWINRVDTHKDYPLIPLIANPNTREVLALTREWRQAIAGLKGEKPMTADQKQFLIDTLADACLTLSNGKYYPIHHIRFADGDMVEIQTTDDDTDYETVLEIG